MLDPEDRKGPEDGPTTDEQDGEGPLEDSEKKKDPFKQKVTGAMEDEIVSRIEGGEQMKGIAADLGLSAKTVGRIAKKHRVSTSKKKNALPCLVASTELLLPGVIEGAMRQAATREIIHENAIDFEQVVRTGKLCVDKFRRHAEAHGLLLNDYLEQAVVFYENYRLERDQLRQDFQTAMDYIEDLEVEVRPYAKDGQRRKDMKELLFVDALMGQRDPELRKKYFSL